MGTLLIDEWFGGAPGLPIIDAASVSVAREQVRAAAATAGLAVREAESIVTAASELAQNLLAHARGGALLVRAVDRLGIPGIEVVAADRGPGLADPERALAGEPKAQGSLGVGLSSVLRLADEVDFDVRIGEGTCVFARKLVEPPPHRSEVAILGRPCLGEPISGDDAAFVRAGASVLIAVADGLGHGAEARAASGAAISLIREHATLEPLALIERCDAALHKTRGSVLAVTRIDLAARALDQACAGNVTTELAAPRSSRRLWSTARVAGHGVTSGKIATESASFPPGELLLCFSDGLSVRAGLPEASDLFRKHPLLVAQYLLATYGRDNDDATVLVAR